MPKSAFFPGTFDPITNGHLDIIERAIQIFDRLVVLVAFNPEKVSFFTVEERVDMIRETTRQWDQIEVDHYAGLLVDYAELKGIRTAVRGLRAVTDFELEFQQALTHRGLNPKFESVFLMTSSEYLYLNSTIIRQIAQLGGDVSKFVPSYVEQKVKEKVRYQKK